MGNFIPKDNDNEPDSSDDEDNVEENEEKPKLLRRKFPKAIGDAMFKDPILQKYVAERRLPKEGVIQKFLEKHPPLPEGYDWHDVKAKLNTRIQNEKKKEANAKKKDQKRKKAQSENEK